MEQRYYYSIASGSSGNCGLYVAGATAVLIDLGVSVRALRQALAALELDIQDLTGVLITHEHTDHIKGLATFVKKYNIPLYASQDTAEALICKTPAAADRLQPFCSGAVFELDGLRVHSFGTPHDAADSVGYILEDGTVQFGFATDLGFVPDAVQRQLMRCDAVVLESNHDPFMLQAGPYPWPLKQRVSGPRGHLSNPDCAVCATALAKSGVHTLILAHLSEHNNTPVTAFRETRRALDAAGADCALHVAPRGPMESPVRLDTEARACCL